MKKKSAIQIIYRPTRRKNKPGAGRPQLGEDKLVRMSAKVRPEQAEWLKAQSSPGGTVRRMIDDYMNDPKEAKS